jgi:hypothetical protein
VCLLSKLLQGKKTYRKCIRKFRCEYPDSPVPTKSCVSKLVKNWRATGSVCEIKKQSKRIVLTEEKVRDVEARLQISVHELKRPDYEARIHFCNWLLQNVHDGICS